MSKKYYITITNKYLSGWENANNKIDKFIIIYNTELQAKKLGKKNKKKNQK